MYKVLLVLLLASCTVSREPNCFNRAIILKERTEIRGLSMEYAYLKAKYPGYRIKIRSFAEHKSRKYDILEFYPGSYTKHTLKVYFDVTSFYGKLY